MQPVDAHLMADILRESLRRGEEPVLIISSNSMAPLLKAGDSIRITAVAPTDIQRGDVVTFIDEDNPSEPTTHRIWDSQTVDGTLIFITRGDRPQLFDKPFENDQLIGRVVARQRSGRTLRLDTGQGQWLSQRLAHSSANQLYRQTKIKCDADQNVLTAVAASNAAIKRQAPHVGRSLERRVHSIMDFMADWIVEKIHP